MNDKLVMVVDDDASTLATMGEMLSELNIDTQLVSSAGECLANLASTPDKYSAILMDVHMPALSGTDASRWIKDSEAENLRSIPIFALTADPRYKSSEHVAEFGMTDVLQKPVRGIDLGKLLENRDRHS